MTYDVYFSDGEIKDHLANALAENMHLQEDEDGHKMQVLDYIVDCRKYSDVVDKADMWLHAKSGQ